MSRCGAAVALAVAVLGTGVLAAARAAAANDAGRVSGALPTASAATPSAVLLDPRLRTVLYSADEIYRLPAYVGYQIDVQFAPTERLVGLGAGDLEGLTISAAGNHLFIKPRASNVRTNLTVLTTLRTYQFDYVTLPRAPDGGHADVVYALRFLYPAVHLAAPAVTAAPPAQGASTAWSASTASVPGAAKAALVWDGNIRRRNTDYRYCGRAQLRPVTVWDDGVQTHLRFGPRSELPAVFVRNDDGSESLVNFHVEGDELVLHRIARHFVLRRGRLVGCLINQAFAGSGADLVSGTLSPRIERSIRVAGDEVAH